MIMQHELIDVLIVEDENELAQLHAELIGKHPRLRLVGIASSLADAQTQLESKQPQLLLLDNYLPDGKGITLISNPMLARANCSVIFITAAAENRSLLLSERNLNHMAELAAGHDLRSLLRVVVNDGPLGRRQRAGLLVHLILTDRFQ